MRSPVWFLKHTQVWLGQGFIRLEAGTSEYPVYMKWEIACEGDLTLATQSIEIPGLEVKKTNRLVFSDFEAHAFSVTFCDQEGTQVLGRGAHSDLILSWRYAETNGFAGEELYTYEGNQLSVQGTYGSPPYRLFIRGTLWIKA